MNIEMLKNVVNSFIQTAEWVEIDSDIRHNGFTNEAKEWAKLECTKFIECVQSEFSPSESEAILTHQGNDVTALCGHDFYLTRNHHGAGFWDKEIYDTLAVNGCKRLTDIAHSFDECNIIIQNKKLSFT